MLPVKVVPKNEVADPKFGTRLAIGSMLPFTFSAVPVIFKVLNVPLTLNILLKYKVGDPKFDTPLLVGVMLPVAIIALPPDPPIFKLPPIAAPPRVTISPVVALIL